MPKKLFYVDDQEDTLYLIKTLFDEMVFRSVLELELKLYVGTGRIVQIFMNKMEKQNAEQHYYILDINMPIPRQLKLQAGIWPQDHPGDSQYCGIALAKWLHTKKDVPQKHIALLTHWVDLQEFHQNVLSELELDDVVWVAKHKIRRHLGKKLKEWGEKS
jgi:hypothetical protein